MADGINFNLLGVGELSPYQQAQQRDIQNQLAQQQLASARLQTQMSQQQFEQGKAAAERAETYRAELKRLGVRGDPRALLKHLLTNDDPRVVEHALTGLRDLDRAEEFDRLVGGKPAAGAPAPAPTVDNTAPQPGEALAVTVPNTMPTNALATPAPAPAPTANQLAEPSLDNKIKALDLERLRFIRIGSPQALEMARVREKEIEELRKTQVVAPGASVYQGGKFVGTAPKEDKKPTLVEEYEFAKTPAGGNFKGTLMDFKRTIAEASRTPASAPPVTLATVRDPKDPTKNLVIDARTGRVVGESPKEGLGVELTAKEKQAREAKYPQATAAVKTFETKATSLADDLEKLANHPGLSGISGVLYGRTPAITKDARAAQALYDSIVARGGFAELQAMRQSSPTGGALGNVSNQEGQYLRDAFAAINRTQDTADLKTALQAAAQQVRDSKQRTREAYDATYEYRTGGAAKPAPGKSDVRSRADAIISGGQ